MKKYKIRMLVVALSILSVGCSEDFLNDPKPTDVVSEDVIYGSVEGANAYLAGIYRLMRGQYEETDSGNLGSMYFARTVKGNDVMISANWFVNDYAHQNKEANYRRSRFTWSFLYELIKHANTFIIGVNGSTAISEEEKNTLLGQAYGIRAYCYFELSLEFQQTYRYDTSLDAPPIYKEPTIIGQPMSTQAELYDFIVEDLLQAIALSDADSEDHSSFNKKVASAVLARVYQVMGNWPGAAQQASLAYGGDVEGALSAATYGNGFKDFNDTEWIWANPQIDTQSAYYYTAPHAFLEHLVSAYNNAFININFVATFSDTDVRNLFDNLYGLPDTNFRSRITKKFAFSFDSDVPIIRTPEMILIEAEAKINNGDEAGGHNLLFQLQKNRDPQATISTNTGTALLEEVYLERRKELYGEIGVEWYDAKRLRRGIVRDPIHPTAITIAPDDKLFILKIPIGEIDANPNIDNSVNANR